MIKVGSSLLATGFLFLSAFSGSAWAFDVQVADAPDSNLSLTVSAIRGAQKSIYLNIYEFTSPQIADALLERIQAGVHVDLLEEGQPVGGLSAAAKGIQAQIAQAMSRASGGDHLYEMTSKAGGKRRYRFDHAKYAVIDNVRLLIGSENYSPTGNPEAGSVGNRGWEVLISDSTIALDFEQLFEQDTSLAAGDVQDLTSLATDVSAQAPARVKDAGAISAGVPSNFQTLSASAVERISSPDTSLNGLVGLIQSAKQSIDIEQMTFDSSWGTHSTATSPLLSAVIAAARRGVRVRALLNDERVFNHGNTTNSKNGPTADILNQLAAEGLAVSARIANLKAMGVDYIHNKGVLVDGDKTLISSINWDENSVERNRETAVVLTSPAVHDFYEKLFENDWTASGGTGATFAFNALREKATTFDVTTDSTTQCPESVELSVKVGKLDVKDAEDQDFATLSGKTFSGTFNRSGAGKCILTETESTSNAARPRYVEVRTGRDGSVQLILEGYTPVHQKLYSIRTRLSADDSVEGSHLALVYDGSSPGKEKLGQARMSVQILSRR